MSPATSAISRKQLKPGDVVAARMLTDINGQPVPLPDTSSRLVHLQFRRFAGCPLCNTHLRTFVNRQHELTAAGLREIVFFHSSPELLADYGEAFPFTLIADPSLNHYHDFGVETSPWALVHASVFGALLRSLRTEKFKLPKVENGRLGLPADILLDHTGRVLASKYGRHAYDQWTVDEVLREVLRKTPSDIQAGDIDSRLLV